MSPVTTLRFAELQREELDQARAGHPDPQRNLHESYAVLLEEVDELWDMVKLKASKRVGADVLSELVQIAAMAQRAAEDLGYVHADNRCFGCGV